MRTLFLGLCSLLLATAPLSAQTVTWTLSGVTFGDGGTATGFFAVDFPAGTVTSWSLSVSGGNMMDFPALTYGPGNSSEETSFPPGTLGRAFEENGSNRQLRLHTVAALTAAGGTIALDNSGVGFAAAECYDCSPFRVVTAGELVGTVSSPEPVPTLGEWGLLALIALLAGYGVFRLRES